MPNEFLIFTGILTNDFFVSPSCLELVGPREKLLLILFKLGASSAAVIARITEWVVQKNDEQAVTVTWALKRKNSKYNYVQLNM